VLLKLWPSAVFAELWRWTDASPHHAAVVQIRAGNAGGTGCLVWKSEDGQKGVVLTAAHVVEGQQIAKAIWSDGYQSAGHISAEWRTQDVACFEVIPPANAVAVPVAPDPVPFGTAGEVCGYGGPGNRLRHFAVTAETADSDRTTWRGVVISGDSGGPIFVEVDGQQHVAGTVIGGPNVSPIAGTDWQAVHPVFSSRTGNVRAILTQCYGGQCVPPSRGSPIQSPPSGGSTLYPPQSRPAAPIAKPTEIDYDKIIAGVLAGMEKQSEKFRGPPGKDGMPGMDGIPGAAGAQGPAGIDGKTPDDAAIQVAVASWIASHPNEIARMLPPIYFQKVDGRTGEVIAAPIPVQLGEGFSFIVTPPK